MADDRTEKTAEIITRLAGEFIQREAGPASLITVTRTLLSDGHRNATVFVTVLPEDKEGPALDFLKRKRRDFRGHVKKNSRLQHIPFFDFDIDIGEKNRQRIDELSKDD